MEVGKFAYKVGTTVSFEQGNASWDHNGIGLILVQQHYLECNAYLVEMPDGVKVQVIETQITGVIAKPKVTED